MSETVTITAGGRTIETTREEMPGIIRKAIGAKLGRSRGAKIGQADIEDPDKAGVHPKQAARETEVGGIAADRLRSIVERIERLEEERKALGADIKDIWAEAKSAGFAVKVVRRVVQLRKQDPATVEEEETLLDLYRQALGV